MGLAPPFVICYDYGMSPDIENVIKQALKLPSQMRAFIAETLLESLDFEEPFDLSGEWREEIGRHCRQINGGQVQLTPGDKVFTETVERLQN